MQKYLYYSILGLIFLVQVSYAQIPTFSEDIAPIIYNNCTSCHRAGEIGPMSFTNYEEISSWGGMIKYVTAIQYMPPWKPDKAYTSFIGEKGLTAEELQLIADWVDNGMPQGDPALEPALPNFPDGSQLGDPDLVLTMEEAYTIEGNNEDDYRVFVLPTNLSEDKEIAAVEFRPGNKRAVHHALIAYNTTGAAAEMDAETPEYGYEAFGGFGVGTQGRFTGYTPGIQTIPYPQGVGKTLPAGADLLIQVHYAPLPTDETDQSRVNIFFKETNDPIEREVKSFAVTPLSLPGGFFSFRIEADSVKTFHAESPIVNDRSLLNVYPHCHLLGQDWEIFAVTPEQDTIPIIKIEEWDFNWQGAYSFKNLKKIPAGSTIHTIATYDNTVENPLNPNFPPELVTWGEKTTDEMILVGFQYVDYEPGDEDLIITDIKEVKDNANNNRLFPPFPNPTKEVLSITFDLEKAGNLSINLLDLNGRVVRIFAQNERYTEGQHQLDADLKGLANGAYIIQLEALDFQLTEKVIIAN
jgi:hypothetical protein